MALLVREEKERSTMRPPVKGFLRQGVQEEDQTKTDEGAWATFGPTEEDLEGENWAKDIQKNQSFDFSCSSDSRDADSWDQFDTDRTSTNDTDGWQDFSTASGEFDENHCSLFTASVNLGSCWDSVEAKPRSVSLPFEPEQKSSSLAESSRAVFRELFHASADLHTDGACTVSLASIQSLVNQSFWLCLASRACLPEHLSRPHTASENRLSELLLSSETCTLAAATPGTGSPSDLGREGGREGRGGGGGEESEGFDWSIASDKKSPFSPDLLPSFFRPKPTSPVNIDFDHSKAAMGLAMLSVSELRSMCEEMGAKFQRLSGVLISELQLRDQQVHELDVRNRFISAMLHVQNQRHGFGVNGSMDGLLRGRTWTRSTRGKEEKYSGKFLHSIVPYRTPEGLHWSVSTLRQLTDILQAIAEDSDTVPSLVSDYMQSEVLVSPVEERSFQDSEPDLSTSSV